MDTWSIEYRRSWLIYTYRLRPVHGKTVLPSVAVLHGSTYWAWTIDGVKRKALREIETLGKYANDWKELKIG